MVTLPEVRKRVNDCAVQTRCDKRTLATLTQWLLTKRGYVLSMSATVRECLEMLEQMVITKAPELEILSSEDADNILTDRYNVNLHPMRTTKKGKQVPTYNYSFRKQLDLEDALLEDREPAYVKPKTKQLIEHGTIDISADDVREAIKRYEESKQEPEQREPRTPDNMETPEQAHARRLEEDEQAKDEMATVPASALGKDSNADDH